VYEKLEKLMVIKGVTPYQVSKDTGIATSTLSEWKKGKYRPKIEKLKILANYFEVTLDYLVDNDLNKE